MYAIRSYYGLFPKNILFWASDVHCCSSAVAIGKRLNKLFAGKDVDLTGLEVREGSKTFRWTGTSYNFV